MTHGPPRATRKDRGGVLKLPKVHEPSKRKMDTQGGTKAKEDPGGTGQRKNEQKKTNKREQEPKEKTGRQPAKEARTAASWVP